MEEVHRVRVAAVLAADAELEVGPGGPAGLGGRPHQRADAVAVDGLEGADAEDALLQVRGEEAGLHVVAGEAPHRLGEVVGAEGEELGGLGDLIGRQRGARQLDHRAERQLEVGAGGGLDAGDDALGLLADDLQLLDGAHQRDHDLGARVALGVDPLGRGLGDRPHLHGEQAGDDQAQAHAAQAQHRVLLVQLVHGLQQAQVVLVGVLAGLGERDAHGQLGDVRQELVQRRVQQPDGDRQPVHGLEELDEVGLLQREKGTECLLALGVGVREDEALDHLAPLAEEHVLGAAQADALGAEATGARGVLGVVGVGPHPQPAHAVGVGHHPVHGLDQLVGVVGARVHAALEVLHDRGRHDRDLAQVDLAGGAVDGDDVALLDDDAAGGGHPALLGVDLELLGAADAGLAHAARDDGRVRGLAAARGQDALGGDHAVEVVGVGLAADQDDLLARARPLHGGVRVEDGPADRGARRGGDAAAQQLGLRLVVEAREHQLRELGAGDALQRLGLVDQALVHQLRGDAEGGAGGALAHAGLQHPQLAALDGELDVAQVLVVRLQRLHDLHQLVVRGLVELLELGELHGVADAGDDVLALGVLQVVAVDALVAAGGVAGEGDAGAGVGAEVAEDHRADVDGGAEVAGDALLAAVELGAVAVPGVEDRHYGEVHLLARVLREVAAGLLGDDGLELLHEALEVARVEVDVGGDALGPLGLLQRLLEEVAVDAQDGLAEHLDEATVRVPGEPLVARLGGEAGHGLVGEADVQDGVHHARHGELGAGADRDQQRVVGLAELLAHPLLEGLEVGGDLVAHRRRLGAALEVDLAGLGGDREAGGHGQSEVGHLGEVGPLPAEQVLEVLVALGEVVDELLAIFGYRHGNRLLTWGLPDPVGGGLH